MLNALDYVHVINFRIVIIIIIILLNAYAVLDKPVHIGHMQARTRHLIVWHLSTSAQVSDPLQ